MKPGKPKIPGGLMRISKARTLWGEVRKAAISGDPVRMETAVSKFETLAEMAFAAWVKDAQEKGEPE